MSASKWNDLLRGFALLAAAVFIVAIILDFRVSFENSTGLYDAAMQISGRDLSSRFVRHGKCTKKWIVVTSIQQPTEDVKRLCALPEWTVLVVGDSKTPPDWYLECAHFLSLQDQRKLGFASVRRLPQKSYTRKNAGYLYAIANGAEWIYDTDDDNKPYGKGLDQFDFDDVSRGIRFHPPQDDGNNVTIPLKRRLFNPYRHFGSPEMWPRGFPLQYFSSHRHEKGTFRVCQRMTTAAVQQGIVHKDPDVDAIYRLLHGDPSSGLDENFNKFAPPVTLATGTYAPWNSQNTLFHRRAFFGLFLPTTVAFRVTDIWRSFYTQKLLHLIGESVSFVPPNAVQNRNQHDFLKDFDQEIDVYDKAGDLLHFLDVWECADVSIEECAVRLAFDMADAGFWGTEDAELIKLWISDLREIGYQFPALLNATADSYNIKMDNKNVSSLHNCRPMHIELHKDQPANAEMPALERAEEKIRNFGDLESWCRLSPSADNFSLTFPTPDEVAEAHAKEQVFREKLDTVLILTHNYRWSYGMGYQQRLYGGFFAAIFFCGAYDEEQIVKAYDDKFPPFRGTINYVYMSEAEMHMGYRMYYCLAKVQELRLQNVKGYFMVADDTAFNVFHPINLSIPNTIIPAPGAGPWWPGEYGTVKMVKSLELIHGKYANDTGVQWAWREYEKAVSKGDPRANATKILLTADGWMTADWLYLPASNLTYFATLANVFFEAQVFLEVATHKLMLSLSSNLYKRDTLLYLWGSDRLLWAKYYNAKLIGMHTLKMSMLIDEKGPLRPLFCRRVLCTMHEEIFMKPVANLTRRLRQ